MSCRVLVADADPHWADLCQRFLEQCGFRVETADSAADCVEKARRLLPDALVLDLGLLGHEARSLPALLAERGREAMVFVTGMLPPDSLSALSGVPGARCLQKPFRMKVLLTRLSCELTACRGSALRALEG